MQEDLTIGLDFISADAPEEADDKFRIIDKKDYVPEWEAEVQRYMSMTPTLPKNTINYVHEQPFEGGDKLARQQWELMQINRCKNGYNGMSGKMYFYFNFCYIQKLGKKLRPEFRVIDNVWFSFIEACQKSNEWGVICVKRRRVGASWKEAADVLHDCIFNTQYKVGMNSKTDRDSMLLFLKVKFMYENLPPFLRIPTTKSSTKNYMDFSYVAKDTMGNKITKGNESSIVVVAPTDTAYEGQALSKWICDEAGKIKNLATLWRYTEDCLMVETRRVGIPIIFGTAGDITEEGRDLEYMWRNAAKYKLKKFFFCGYMGLRCDELGNDDKLECIRWIVYERHRREGLRVEELKTFIQKYPLTVMEAFTVNTAAGVGDIIKIKAQQESLRTEPPKKVVGRFRMMSQGSVDFIPDPRGECIIYEHPTPGIDSLYIGGCDPADHNEVFDEVSNLSMYIIKRQRGTERPKIVFEYTARPSDLTEYYEQAMMACIYFNNAKLLIERNRYLMINFFENSNYKHLLARTPVGVIRVTRNGRMDTVGIMMTPANKEFLKGLIAKYVEDDYQLIPSLDLLEEFTYFGARNTDRAMAFGIALMLLEDYSHPITASDATIHKTPHFDFKRVNGQIKRVILSKTPNTAT